MALITAYKPIPVDFTHGEGIYLYDKSGQAYLDAYSGIAVTGLGHAHPRVTQTICEQAKKLLHTSNTYQITQQLKLAEQLTDVAGMEQVFFTNSGAEANEAAIKITRLFGHQRGIDQPAVIVMENAFHGRTMATLSATASRNVQAGFEPLLPGFIRAPYNDIEAIKTIAEHNDNIVAVMLEPIQGESGINVPDTGYLAQLSALCEQHDWLMVLDEVQTGNARTGQWFAYQWEKAQPHVITTAKGLGNGMPVGACLMRGKANDLLLPGRHASTFGGNPLACATALTVLDVIENDVGFDHIRTVSEYLHKGLHQRLHHLEQFVEVRGKGLMIGIAFNQPCLPIKNIAFERNLLLGTTAETVVRLLPPLIISQDDADKIIDGVGESVEAFFS